MTESANSATRHCKLCCTAFGIHNRKLGKNGPCQNNPEKVKTRGHKAARSTPLRTSAKGSSKEQIARMKNGTASSATRYCKLCCTALETLLHCTRDAAALHWRHCVSAQKILRISYRYYLERSHREITTRDYYERLLRGIATRDYFKKSIREIMQ